MKTLTILLALTATAHAQGPPIGGDDPPAALGLVEVDQVKDEYAFSVHAHAPDDGEAYRVVWEHREWWGGDMVFIDWRLVSVSGGYWEVPVSSLIPDQCLATAWLEVWDGSQFVFAGHPYLQSTYIYDLTGL